MKSLRTVVLIPILSTIPSNCPIVTWSPIPYWSSNKIKNPLIKSLTKLWAPIPIANPPALTNATGILVKISYNIDPTPIIYTVYFNTLLRTSPIVIAFCGSNEKLVLLLTCLSTNLLINLFPILIEKYIRTAIKIIDIIFSIIKSKSILLTKKLTILFP